MIAYRRFVSVCGLALLPILALSYASSKAHAAAAEAATSASAAGGWINLFDGETLYGWTQFGDVPWRVADKAIVGESGAGGWLATTTQFMNFELTAKVRIKAGTSAGLVVRAGLEGHPSENGTTVIPLSEPEKTEPPFREIHVLADGPKVTVTLDGKPVEVAAGSRAKGYIGIQYHHTGGKVEVQEMKLRPLGLKPLFNAKDLNGWNIIPGKKSVFSVVDGALNIKNGNGQIETAGTYKDFFLQLDVFSNGDKLNSGIFFHSPPNVFWKGYESQVRNDWQGEDRTKPNDFGTGGNYGNQPARKVVSSDRKWWQQTIVVDGNHAACWVDGYLVSDFTDTRPVSPESQGKAGYVPGPGTINLQGHDPTTDLSFKNIGIQEYPAK